MEIAGAVLAALLTSAVVSTLITVVAGHYFDKRLEAVRTELQIAAHEALALANQKLEVFPRIVELVYRIRNLARAIATGDDPDGAEARDLRQHAAALENDLYASRLLLQTEEVFVPIHRFKNELQHFNQLQADLHACREEAAHEHAAALEGEMRGSYDRIEEQHILIIRELAVATGSTVRK